MNENQMAIKTCSPPVRCPNPLDNMRSSVPVDKQGKTTSHSQVRRFDVKTFAFLDRDRGRPSVEEVKHMTDVELLMLRRRFP